MLAARHGKTFSLEHPRDSALFHMPDLIKVQSLPKVFAVLVDQCMYGLQEPAGAPRKIRAPMKIITNCLALRALGRVCDNSHDHYYTQKGRPANIPPPALIDSWISLLLETVDERPKTLFELDPWRETLKVSIPAGKRNRDLGTKPDYIIHRQFRSARAAAAAGIQMKKGALPPLLSREVEPGRAVDQISRARFPFDDLESLSPDLTKCVQRIARDGLAATVAFRAKELRHWEGRAKDLRLRSLRELDKAPESIKAVLLRGREIGQFFHIALYREMLKSIDYPDQKYADRLMTGLPIAGPIETSNIWPADLIAASSTIREFENKAWEYREKLEKDPRYDHRIYDRPQEKGGPISYTNQIWESTIEETKDQEKAEDKVGTFMEGPYEAKDVSKILKTEKWVPIKRFPVLQNNKLRPCDDGAQSGLNSTTSRKEKLVCSSVDHIAALIRMWRFLMPQEEIGGWALDEKKAYRQIPILPSHRKYAVVAVVDPKSGSYKYFLMNSHSFGFTSAVYNYNRRPLSLQYILVKIFRVPTDFYFDDRFGFEPKGSIRSSFDTTKKVYQILGVLAEDSKAQGPEKNFDEPEILGVLFDLKEMMIRIKEGRRVQLTHEIDQIIDQKLLLPGHAAKLKGKLMFGASQLYGKTGRAALRSLSERQYESRGDFSIKGPIEASLQLWKKLVHHGRPRSILSGKNETADAFFFTDASSGEGENLRKNSKGSDKSITGGVLFCWWRVAPIYFSLEITKEVISKWLPRKSQINQLEMLACIILVNEFKHELANKRVIGLIDSEGALGGLIKGYSRKDDISELVSIFWEIVSGNGISIYLDRVSTDMNVSDEVSRGIFKIANECRWERRDTKTPREVIERRPGDV